MRIAILGGGFTGLTAAYDLSKAGHEVVVLEKDTVLGGLAAGFTRPDWDWYLERAYHHLFTNDSDILTFAQEIGFDGMMRLQPETASLYRIDGALRTLKLDAPSDLLSFPLLAPLDRIRAGIVLAFFKVTPFLRQFEQISAASFLRRWMGHSGWDALFSELFRKKFGKYAEKILTSFIWARIKKRSKDLVYIRGGFQSLLDHLTTVLEKQGVELRTGWAVQSIRKNNGKYAVIGTAGARSRTGDAQEGREGEVLEGFDRVICTLPTPLIPTVTSQVLSVAERESLSQIAYLGALNMVVVSDQPLLDQTYWLSVCVKEFPMMVLVQHTNLVSPAHYGGKHLLYVGNYLERDDPLMKGTDIQVIEQLLPYLNQIKQGFEDQVDQISVFRAPFAQPIFDREFLDHMPGLQTSDPGLVIANLDMTYPYDRGTNFAVRLGRQAAAHVVQ